MNMKFDNFLVQFFYFWTILFALFHIITGYFTQTMMLQRAIHLAFAIPLSYFIWVCDKNYKKISWLVVPITLIVSFVGIYVFKTYVPRGMLFGLPLPQHELYIGFLFLSVIIFICFITAGTIMTSLVALSILYARFGNYLPGILKHSGFSWNRIITDVVYSSEGIFGSLTGASATYIFLIVLFGSFLFSIGADNFIIDITNIFVGRLRGGPAKMAVIASGLFGMISGSALANVAVTGNVTIPLMKKNGYEPEFASAVESVASSGGGIMPPIMGTSAFIMAEILCVPYWSIAKSAIIPALIYFIYVYFMVDLRAKKIGLEGLKNISRSVDVLQNGWFYIIPIFVFVFSLAILRVSITRVAFYGIISTLLLFIFIPKLKKDGINTIFQGFKIGSYNAIPVVIIIIAAQIIICMLSLTGLGLKFSSLAVRLCSDSFFLLLVVGMFASIILGMGLPTIACYIIISIFIAPSLVKAGIYPLAAHLFGLYYAVLSVITPPVAPAVFVAAGIAKCSPMRTAIESIKLALPGFLVPFIFVYDKSLLLIGDLNQIFFSIIKTFLGIILLGMTSEGYGIFNIGFLNIYERIIFGILGIFIFIPYYKYNVIGMIAGLGIVVFLFKKRKAKTL